MNLIASEKQIKFISKLIDDIREDKIKNYSFTEFKKWFKLEFNKDIKDYTNINIEQANTKCQTIIWNSKFSIWC